MTVATIPTPRAVLLQGGTDVVGIGHSTTYWVALALIWCAAMGRELKVY